ncbi:hypothetical protein H0H93_002903 [Arthromyces matolae]|nr:hypothetical protein H0H93_002903 [Arthromyces matolae]
MMGLMTLLTKVNRYKLSTTSADVRLKVIGNSTSYSLGYAEGDTPSFTFPVTFDSSALSLAPAGGFYFKGAAFGIYNTGNGKPSLVPADFKYWQQTPTALT